MVNPQPPPPLLRLPQPLKVHRVGSSILHPRFDSTAYLAYGKYMYRYICLSSFLLCTKLYILTSNNILRRIHPLGARASYFCRLTVDPRHLQTYEKIATIAVSTSSQPQLTSYVSYHFPHKVYALSPTPPITTSSSNCSMRKRKQSLIL